MATARAPRARSALICAAGVVLLVGCGGSTADGGDEDAAATSSGSPSSASAQPQPLPEAEDITSLDALTLEARPFADFALTVDDTVWVSGVDPGIVG
jgi:virginiamycin B lyase